MIPKKKKIITEIWLILDQYFGLFSSVWSNNLVVIVDSLSPSGLGRFGLRSQTHKHNREAQNIEGHK